MLNYIIILSYVMLSYAILSYIMLDYVMLSYAKHYYGGEEGSYIDMTRPLHGRAPHLSSGYVDPLDPLLPLRLKHPTRGLNAG